MDSNRVRCYNSKTDQVRYIRKDIVDSGSAKAQGFVPQPEPEQLMSIDIDINPAANKSESEQPKQKRKQNPK